MLAKDRPPPIDVSLSWRDLYLDGAFAQRELVGAGPLSRQADERSIRIGIGQAPFEDLDLEGALQPLAFAKGGYWSGFEVPAIPLAEMTFREDQEPLPWKENYGWETDGFSTVSPLYSPWQILYLDDVVTQGKAELGLDVLLLLTKEREGALDGARGFFELQDREFRQIDESWRGLLKVLVALQNHYWPLVSGRVALVADRERDGDWIEAGRDGIDFDPEATLSRLGPSLDQLSAAYRFLVMRGFDREPRDGLVMLRRARPRPFHVRWRGTPRRAQDNFDAAEVLRLFLLDIGGDVGPPAAELMDGRQAERAGLFAHGPAASVDRKKLKAELLAAELYPHGVEAIVEGPSEIAIIDTIVGALLGPVGLAEISYFDLEGVGAAKQVVPLATSLGAYAVRTVLVVDREGRMGTYIERLIDQGTVDAEDVCLWQQDLEADNSSPAELIELAASLLAAPEDGIPAVELTTTVEVLLAAHEKNNRGRPSTKQMGLAETLVGLVENHDPPARLPKPRLAEALAFRIVAEFEDCAGEKAKMAALYRRRPILGFVVGRVVDAINRSVPVS